MALLYLLTLSEGKYLRPYEHHYGKTGPFARRASRTTATFLRRVRRLLAAEDRDLGGQVRAGRHRGRHSGGDHRPNLRSVSSWGLGGREGGRGRDPK